MGYPDHLRNLTFEQHKALLELDYAEEKIPVETKDEAVQPDRSPGASNLESQKDLNTDLML